MRNSTLLCRRDFWGSPYRLDILTKIFRIIFKYIFCRVRCVVRGLFSSYARNLGGNLLLDVADARNEIPMKYNL